MYAESRGENVYDSSKIITIEDTNLVDVTEMSKTITEVLDKFYSTDIKQGPGPDGFPPS